MSRTGWGQTTKWTKLNTDNSTSALTLLACTSNKVRRKANGTMMPHPQAPLAAAVIIAWEVRLHRTRKRCRERGHRRSAERHHTVAARRAHKWIRTLKDSCARRVWRLSRIGCPVWHAAYNTASMASRRPKSTMRGKLSRSTSTTSLEFTCWRSTTRQGMTPFQCLVSIYAKLMPKCSTKISPRCWTVKIAPWDHTLLDLSASWRRTTYLCLERCTVSRKKSSLESA